MKPPLGGFFFVSTTAVTASDSVAIPNDSGRNKQTTTAVTARYSEAVHETDNALRRETMDCFVVPPRNDEVGRN